MADKTPPPYNYTRFSQLLGPLQNPPTPYRVTYRRLTSKKETLKAVLLAIGNIGVELSFLIWLFGSFLFSRSPTGESVQLTGGLIAILAGVFIVETFRLVNMFTLCMATLRAKEPIPVKPESGTRVAFTTTIVPSKEPFEIVAKTLLRMKKIKHDGIVDVWLLDEGNVATIRTVCGMMGVHHFSRKDIAKWNTPSGRFKTKSKHGNHNAWLDAHGHKYDFVISVDPDHVPLPNFAQRLLGYFRDPDVAFVVGPQVYGNFDTTVTKGAESQAYIFQAAIQRAANASDAAMFVGTNHAFRVKTWEAIGGFQDSITEDMLTSLVVHSNRNPATGNFWKSVYTPDVVAVGEGPSAWTDFFSQQLRWSRGSNEVLLKNFFTLIRRMPWRAKLHYSMIISYYPTVAISWVVGIAVSMLYLVMGQTGLDVSGKMWLALYMDILVVQIVLYGWLRKYNVSPHEKPGTIGFAGMFFSIISAPIYTTALITTLLRRKIGFVVTPKGDSASPDNWKTFKLHLAWAALVSGFMIYSLLTGHAYPSVKIWCTLTLLVCIWPVLQWQISIWDETKHRLLHLVRQPQKWLKLKYAEKAE